MYSLQFLNCRGFRCSVFPCSNDNFQKSGAAIPSSFCGRGFNFKNGVSKFTARRSCGRVSTVFAAVSSSSSSSSFNMNLNQYMVRLEKPLGIRFGLSVEGKVFVLALQKGLLKLENLELNGRLMKLGNAEKSRIVMVGDTLKKASESSTSKLVEIKDYGDMEILVKEKAGSCSLVLERPSSPFPIHLYLLNDLDTLFNESLVPISTWNDHIQSPNSNASGEGAGKSGSVTFCPKLLSSKGWKYLNDQNKNGQPKIAMNSPTLPFGPLVATFTEELPEETTEWGHGSFPLEEYVKALEHSNEELYYNHSLGMHYSKITEQIYVGSCIQTEKDVETLSDTVESQNDIVRLYRSRHLGVTAVLNFQSTIEAANWGIDSNSINESCQKFNILMINHPIRDSDSFDMRKKLPFCVGLLLRLLKKNHRVCITCTTGFDRSPACVIAYLHWITDTSLHAAHNFVTGLHTCRPDRPAIAWATWDLIAMVESGIHDGPSTHAVTFVWNGHEGEDVSLVGDFTGNWKEPIKAVHKGGPKHEVDIRLPQGKYYYKYIINENWRHSTASPTERDERGNVNNVIVIGDTASVEPSLLPPQKDANIVKVIERPLTENERFMLAKAARCVAFSVCPIRLAPK